MEGKTYLNVEYRRVEPENSGIVRRDKRDCTRNFKRVTGYVR